MLLFTHIFFIREELMRTFILNTFRFISSAVSTIVTEILSIILP